MKSLIQRTDTKMNSRSDLSDLYLFNPSCDFAIANSSPFWQPNHLLRSMEKDLDTIPAFLARENDFVIVYELPPESYLQTIARLGIRNRRFITHNELKYKSEKFLLPVGRLLPWGWSPAAHRLLQPVKIFCSGDFRQSPVSEWNPDHKEMYSKKFASTLLEKIIKDNPNPYLLSETHLSVTCETISEIEKYLLNQDQIMIKAPWSSSGRGLQKITKKPVHTAVWQRIGGMIKDQGYVLAEPLVEKLVDLAFEFSIDKSAARFMGISYFSTDMKGQYNGNYLNGPPASITPEMTEFLSNHSDWLVKKLLEEIEKSILPNNYEGFLGIDGLIFKDHEQNLRINPCLEINLRFTMGILAMHLEKLIDPEKKGTFRLFFQPGRNFKDFVDSMTGRYPPVFENERLVSGFFPLTNFGNSTQFGSYLLIEN